MARLLETNAEKVLMVGAGQSQRAAIRRVVELGVEVIAVDGDPGASGLAEATFGEAVDFSDVAAVVEVARRRQVDGVLTVASDRAVPVVAAVAEALGLPGVGTDVARQMTNKLEMRRALERAGVPQPPFAPARSGDELRSATARVGLPAVVKPADSGGQRGLALLRSPDGHDHALEVALAMSSSGEAIVERFVGGDELNAIVVVREGVPELVTLSDRLRPQGAGWGVGWIHLYPSTLEAKKLERAATVALGAVTALGVREGIAFPQLIARPDGEVYVVEVAARIPAGQMADLVRHGTGVDLVEIALLQALGRGVPGNLVRRRFERPLAISFLTAEPGLLPAGRVVSVDGLDAVRGAPGVVQAELYFEPGDLIRPLTVDEDRRGYVIATADSPHEALELARKAATRLDVRVAT